MEKTNLVREPAVAGQFYPASGSDIRRQIASFIDKQTLKPQALACMLPHAGYMYSGRVAAQTLSQIDIKEKIILLGPNHTGYGERVSIMSQGVWLTPLGKIEIDQGLAGQLLKNSAILKEDFLAHKFEHSLEVELPILQYFKTNFKIVPICIMSADLDSLKALGKEIALAINELNLKGSTLLLASSDMTHYDPQAEAEKKDKQAIQAILELNEDKLTDYIQRLNISMCGWAPVVTMLAAAKELGAKSAKLIKYQTSAEITGDKDSVVGYAGITIC